MSVLKVVTQNIRTLISVGFVSCETLTEAFVVKVNTERGFQGFTVATSFHLFYALRPDHCTHLLVLHSGLLLMNKYY